MTILINTVYLYVNKSLFILRAILEYFNSILSFFTFYVRIYYCSVFSIFANIYKGNIEGYVQTFSSMELQMSEYTS